VIELLDISGVPTLDTGGKAGSGGRSRGNYPIIDAATGAEIEAGTYIHYYAGRGIKASRWRLLSLNVSGPSAFLRK
jgi:hypothetical protein